MSGNATDVTDQADIKTWVFDVDDIEGSSLDAAQKAKKKVADETGIGYSKLVGKVVNPRTWSDKYVVVFDWFDRYDDTATERTEADSHE